MIVIALVAFFASGLTLFSGFGLGTLLMPVAAIFFPVDIAIAITAVVHLANNMFKLGLLGMEANAAVVLRFGIPALAAAFLGALVLQWLSVMNPLVEYGFLGDVRQVMPVKLIIGVLIIAFVYIELSKTFATISLDHKFLPLGGLVSGFFGGLSGNQGALRSMFLIKAGLGKEQFIATGVVIAVMVDISRITVYGWDAAASRDLIDWSLVLVATLFAFSGAFIGKRLLQKLTIRSIQWFVSAFLFLVAVGLISGIL